MFQFQTYFEARVRVATALKYHLTCIPLEDRDIVSHEPMRNSAQYGDDCIFVTAYAHELLQTTRFSSVTVTERVLNSIMNWFCGDMLRK